MFVKYSYEEMLERAYKILPPVKVEVSRFEIPRPNIIYQKNKTVILNWKEIVSVLRRDEKLLAKFLGKEYGTPVTIEEGKAIIGKKVTPKSLYQKLELFAKEFVICPVCGKPDTKLIKKGRYLYLKCEACGAESPVRYVL